MCPRLGDIQCNNSVIPDGDYVRNYWYWYFFTCYNFVQIRHNLDGFVRDVAVMFFQYGVDLITKDLLYVRVYCQLVQAKRHGG